MRTIDPQSIKTDYIPALGDVKTTFNAANASAIPANGKKLISEFSFLSAATLLEGFISDLFVAYINRDDSVFVGYLVGKMSIDASDEHSQRAKNFATISIGQHLSSADIRSVLDSRDYNITFANASEMKAGAGKWLADPYKNYFTAITASQSATLAAAKSIRNFLAHRSAASKSEMQTALIAPDLPAPLRRGLHHIRDVGSFLRSRPEPQTPYRLEQYLQDLQQIALTLCP